MRSHCENIENSWTSSCGRILNSQTNWAYRFVFRIGLPQFYSFSDPNVKLVYVLSWTPNMASGPQSEVSNHIHIDDWCLNEYRATKLTTDCPTFPITLQLVYDSPIRISLVLGVIFNKTCTHKFMHTCVHKWFQWEWYTKMWLVSCGHFFMSFTYHASQFRSLVLYTFVAPDKLRYVSKVLGQQTLKMCSEQLTPNLVYSRNTKAWMWSMFKVNRNATFKLKILLQSPQFARWNDIGIISELNYHHLFSGM